MTQNLTLIHELKNSVKGDVLSDEYSLGMYATDASIYQIKPLAIVLPKDEADVKMSVEIARKHGVKILPRGGGTSLAGQTVAEAMILDFSKYMNRILELNVAERWVRAQPGLVRDELNEELEKHGLHFAPDPATSSRANVGGMVGNNSSGTKSILYGKTVDHILAAKVLLADGTELLLESLSPEAYREKTKKQTREGEIYKKFQETIRDNAEEIKLKFPKVMRRVLTGGTWPNWLPEVKAPWQSLSRSSSTWNPCPNTSRLPLCILMSCWMPSLQCSPCFSTIPRPSRSLTGPCCT
jgi:FAD/FMN-containing dehydrogenase